MFLPRLDSRQAAPRRAPTMLKTGCILGTSWTISFIESQDKLIRKTPSASIVTRAACSQANRGQPSGGGVYVLMAKGEQTNVTLIGS